MVGSIPAPKPPEPRNAREIADSSWVMEGPWRDPRDFKRSSHVERGYASISPEWFFVEETVNEKEEVAHRPFKLLLGTG